MPQKVQEPARTLEVMPEIFATFLIHQITFFSGERFSFVAVNQGCQMEYSQTKTPNLGTFWRALDLKSSVNSLAIWNIFRPFGTRYGHWVIWYNSTRFGILCQ
jgi:hypothetical protein